MTIFSRFLVAPLVGAWIEITLGFPIVICLVVAPLVGAWIEIGGNMVLVYK